MKNTAEKSVFLFAAFFTALSFSGGPAFPQMTSEIMPHAAAPLRS